MFCSCQTEQSPSGCDQSQGTSGQTPKLCHIGWLRYVTSAFKCYPFIDPKIKAWCFFLRLCALVFLFVKIVHVSYIVKQQEQIILWEIGILVIMKRHWILPFIVWKMILQGLSFVTNVLWREQIFSCDFIQDNKCRLGCETILLVNHKV